MAQPTGLEKRLNRVLQKDELLQRGRKNVAQGLKAEDFTGFMYRLKPVQCWLVYVRLKPVPFKRRVLTQYALAGVGRFTRSPCSGITSVTWIALLQGAEVNIVTKPVQR